MSYVQGYLIAVPKRNKETYRDMAEKSAPLFKENGALRIVKTWGDCIPDGKVTDFKMAVKAKDDEADVFSRFEWPDKQTYESATAKMESDPRWEDMPEMPYDGKRMMWAGFEPIFVSEN